MSAGAAAGVERLRRVVFAATCGLLLSAAGLGVLQSLRWDGGLPPVEIGYGWYLTELEERGDHERVLAELATAVVVDVGMRHVAHNKIGFRQLARGDAQGAEASFRASLAIAPDYPLAHANLANALEMQGRRDEAIAELERALELRPRWPKVRRSLRRLRKLP